MIWGIYRTYQDGHLKLVPSVWQENRIVRLLSINSNQRNVLHTNRRLGHNVVQVKQPQNIQMYNICMNGGDHHDQLCMNCDVCCFSVKAWKYILWYFVNNGIVNDYIWYYKTSTRQAKKKYACIDF